MEDVFKTKSTMMGVCHRDTGADAKSCCIRPKLEKREKQNFKKGIGLNPKI